MHSLTFSPPPFGKLGVTLTIPVSVTLTIPVSVPLLMLLTAFYVDVECVGGSIVCLAIPVPAYTGALCGGVSHSSGGSYSLQGVVSWLTRGTGHGVARLGITECQSPQRRHWILPTSLQGHAYKRGRRRNKEGREGRWASLALAKEGEKGKGIKAACTST